VTAGLFVQILLALFLCGASCNKPSNSDALTITVEEVHTILERKDDVLLLDVRTPQEYDGELGHLPDALLIPVQELEARCDELQPYKNKEMVVYCRSGNRSARAAEFLTKKGFKVRNMEGGMLKWQERFGSSK
jgi:adenylyltransferase/sulfurtransferase